MPKLLHILNEPEDSLASEIIAAQKQNAANEVEVVDLTRPETDYKKLVEKIFSADSVQVW